MQPETSKIPGASLLLKVPIEEHNYGCFFFFSSSYKERKKMTIAENFEGGVVKSIKNLWLRKQSNIMIMETPS